MQPAIAGIIEGFYGTPWTWEQRSALGSWCAERGMSHYVYAPKDDPLHRERWREPYDTPTLDRFAALAGAGTLELGFALSPGLSIDYRDRADLDAIITKIDQVVTVGVRLLVLALDDIPVRAGLGKDHAELTRRLVDHLTARHPDTRLVLVPTEYTGSMATPYLDALAEGVPPTVPIAWTGPTVITDELTVADARSRTAVLGGRAPLVWDNYPVNDTIMVDRLFLGPLRGRQPGLLAATDGYLANPMVQAHANRLPLASIAAWLRGEDPAAAWEAAADALGWRTFAEACDGHVPNMLVDAAIAGAEGARDELEAWLHAASTCTAPGLEEEAASWLDQVHTEAGVGLLALRAARQALAGDRSEAMLAQVMALTMLWPSARRGPVSVLGPRCSFRPMLSQWPDGTWRFHGSSAQLDDNALDRLVRWSIATVDALQLP